MIYDDVAAVTWFGQKFVLVGSQYLIIPWYLAKTFQLFKVKVGTPEIGNTVIAFAGGCIFTAMGILQIIVDISQIRP